MPSKTNPNDGNYKFNGEELIHKLKYNGVKRKVSDIIQDQLEFLGYIDYKDETLDNRYIIITQLNTRYSPVFQAYCLKNGKVSQMKVHKTCDRRKNNYDTFSQKPFKDCDLVYIKKCVKQPKVRKGGEGEPAWVEIPGEFDWWVVQYDIVR